MNRTVPKTLVLLCGSLLLADCGDEASIGEGATCSFESTCESPALDAMLMSQGFGTARASLTPLEPVWRRTSELGERPASRSYPHFLAQGAPGVLWYVAAREGGTVRLATLDESGTLTAQQEIAPPAGFRADGRLLSATGHPLGPVVGVEWPLTACTGTGPCDDRTELLVFAEDPAAPPRHVAPKLPSYWQPSSAYRTRAGDALVSPNDNLPGVRRIDLDGNIVWDRRLTAKDVREVPDVSGAPYTFDSSTTGALSPTDSYVIGLTAPDMAGNEVGAGLLDVDADGKTSLLRYGPRSHSFGGRVSATVFDPSGRLTLFHGAPEGDLTVLQIDGPNKRMYLLLREDYRELALGPVAADAAGTVYVMTFVGGRSMETGSHALCRITLQGDGRCFAMPEEVVDLEATAPGVVFALTATSLARYDVP